MKRDFDLIREILLDVEENAKDGDLMYFPKIEGHTEGEISYHIKLLGDAGFVDIYSPSNKSMYHNNVRSITWQGHEFLDHIRSPKVWQKVKKTAIEKAVDLSVDIIKTFSGSIIKAMTE